MPKSTNGTGIMEISPLSFKEICAIIKSCGENGVTLLKLGPLEISLQPRLQSPEASQIHIIKRETDPETARSVITGGEELQTQTPEDIKRMLDDYRKAQDLINDPEAHEQDAIERAIRE